MAKKSTTAEALYKCRTREHVLEELSFHHIKGLVLRCGFSMEETSQDYGLDLWIQTYSNRGDVETDCLWMQVKAAESLDRYILKGGDSFSFPIDVKDIRCWTEAAMPVYLILFDATLAEAYWLDTNEILSGVQKLTGKQKKVRVPRSHVLGAQTLRLMQEHKNAMVASYRTHKKSFSHE